MKAYADYEFYVSVFGGRFVSEDMFVRMALEASAFVDSQTFAKVVEPIEEVKLAVCALAEICMQRYKANCEDQIASEAVGPHTVSYVKKANRDYRKEMATIVNTYLASTGLLYRGVTCGC